MDASAEPRCAVSPRPPPAGRAGQEVASLTPLLHVALPADHFCGRFTSRLRCVLLNFQIVQHCMYLQNLISQHTHTILHFMLVWTKRMCHPEFFCPSTWTRFAFLGAGRVAGTSLQPQCSLKLVQPLEPLPQGRAALPIGCSRGLRAR